MHVLHFMNPQLAKLHQLLMENECGLLPHPDLKFKFVVNDTNEELTSTSADLRIINGQRADFAIPWLVRLAIKKAQKESICTGFIITSLHIMTAAHCLCNAQNGECITKFSTNILMDHDRAFAFVGSGGGVPKKDMIRHRAKYAIVHPHYTGKGAYDIAILVMHAKIRFSPNVKPICLPTQEIQDEDRKAFTAGYGLRYVSQKKEDAVLADKLQSSCLTNEIGPSTFKHCQGGWMNCNRIDLPPINKTCLKWQGKALNSSIPSSLQSFVDEASIIKLIGDLSSTCYSNLIGEYGWCYTIHGLQAWGYCSRSCMMGQNPMDKELEYVTLHIFDPKKCRIALQAHLELCVGGIAPRALQVSFKTQMQGITHEDYKFTFDGVEQDPRFNITRIGFQDSCSGDSGSPLWVFQGQRAIVVGLTSRGASICGQMNSPAVYTRVKALLPWIRQTLNENSSQRIGLSFLLQQTCLLLLLIIIKLS